MIGGKRQAGPIDWDAVDERPPTLTRHQLRTGATLIALVLVVGYGAHLVLQLRPLSVGRSTRVSLTYLPPCANPRGLRAFGESWELTGEDGHDLYVDTDNGRDRSQKPPVSGVLHRDSKRAATFRADDGRSAHFRALLGKFSTGDCAILP